jgi:hypothetical protein
MTTESESEIEPVTGLTVKELIAVGEAAYATRNDPDAWEDVEVEIDPDVRSVVSVRLSREESASLSRAAMSAGMAVSTYIRNAALASISEPSRTVDVDAVRRAWGKLLNDVEATAKEMDRSLTPMQRGKARALRRDGKKEPRP